MRFPQFASVESHLNSLINYEVSTPVGGSRDRPKLEPVIRAAERLQLRLELRNCFHIAGTKGKGSVAAFITALLSSHGSTLTFTSPHLVSVRERIALSGKLIADEMWCEGFSSIVPQLEASPGIHLTYFESVWIFYLWVAQQLNTAIHVVECGLGGKWDATNVLKQTTPVITLVDYDHTDILGKTLSEIARDKCGIIKPNCHAVVSRQHEESAAAIRSAIDAAQARSSWLDHDYRWKSEAGDSFNYRDELGDIDSIRLAAAGLHQPDNAATAICAARLRFPFLEPGEIRERLAALEIPGRQQLLAGNPPILLDVAHNPVSFRSLASTLRANHQSKKIIAVIGMMKDKDAANCLQPLAGLVHEMLIVEPDSPRSMPAVKLIEMAVSVGISARVEFQLGSAFEWLHTYGKCDIGLVAGSFILAGDYLKWRVNAGIA